MRSIARRVLRLLSAGAASRGRAAALRLQVELARIARPPVTVPAPAARRILVLAPHMDDEVFGCGGTLAACAEQGAEIRAIYLTDGSKGYANATPPGPLSAAERQLVQTRKEEAARAGKRIGIAAREFLDLPDGALQVSADAIARLQRALEAAPPELVFVPFLLDLHRDHWATNGLFVEAARRAGLPRGLRCWGYEVWTPLLANTLVDISHVMERKREAMREFRSQITDVDYPRAVEGLNTYRSLLGASGRGFAEAFFAADFELYARLHRLADAAR